MRFYVKIWMFFVCLWVCAAAEEEKKSICLNMIVKNESGVIEKCLASVKPLIDYWIIVDTGSDDSTKEIIKEVLKDIPGELHECAWINFEHNRNEALALAKEKGDYVLLIDADEVLQFSENFALPPLEKDLYFIRVRQIGGAEAKRNGLIKNSLNWKWKGIIHEAISAPDARSSEVLQGVVNLCNTHADGISGRSKQSVSLKYLRDAEILEKVLKEEPNNSRYMYYLGISYAAAGKYELAKASFEKRIRLPSSDFQETFMAMYNLGVMHEKLEEFDLALKAFAQAYTFYPSRAEPIFHSAALYRKKGELLLGYLLSQYALTLPYPEDDFCVEYTVYDFAALIEFANCALLLKKYPEGYEACRKLLENPHLPDEYRAQVLANFELAKKKISFDNPK